MLKVIVDLIKTWTAGIGLLVHVLSVFKLQSRSIRNMSAGDKKFYPQNYSNEAMISLMENGVEIKSYKRVCALLPSICETLSGKMVVEHFYNNDYSHILNWTKENVQNCLDFVIDLSIKMQDTHGYSEGLLHRMEAFEDHLEVVEEVNVEWLTSNDLEPIELKIGQVVSVILLSDRNGCYEFLLNSNLMDIGRVPISCVRHRVVRV